MAGRSGRLWPSLIEGLLSFVLLFRFEVDIIIPGHPDNLSLVSIDEIANRDLD